MKAQALLLIALVVAATLLTAECGQDSAERRMQPGSLLPPSQAPGTGSPVTPPPQQDSNESDNSNESPASYQSDASNESDNSNESGN
ncbi:variant surface antigen F-like [Protopterus annectens]|uniref:variant surface antigen F-like n=1 Tax=Protopterus annectens TaxID=7888 RepID=UPI001CF9771D|nr:variant surface antigen F-like [Protopterus annectens]